MFTIQLNSIQTIKENIMTYFNGTLQEFTYLHEQVTEISNPDESYLGTLNLFFKEPVTSNDEQTYFEYLTKILKDDAIDTWTLREQEEINKLDLTQGLHIFLYDIYTGIISHCQTNKPTNQEPIYESEHIIILDSDSTIGCQE
jgi:hypothetical protein